MIIWDDYVRWFRWLCEMIISDFGWLFQLSEMIISSLPDYFLWLCCMIIWVPMIIRRNCRGPGQSSVKSFSTYSRRTFRPGSSWPRPLQDKFPRPGFQVSAPIQLSAPPSQGRSARCFLRFRVLLNRFLTPSRLKGLVCSFCWCKNKYSPRFGLATWSNMNKK